MLRYVAGRNIAQAMDMGNKLLAKNKIPILNYMIEKEGDAQHVFLEYTKMAHMIPNGFKVALKLSSIEFDPYLASKLLDQFAERNIPVMIDAESSEQNQLYQQRSNSLLREFNRDKIRVYKTYQMYRKDSGTALKKNHDTHGSRLGVKLVRGAYWNSEKNNGELHETKEKTDTSYNLALIQLHKANVSTILATHNPISINLGVLINTVGTANKFEFAQLMGMSEKNYNTISVNHAVNVYVPYGPYMHMFPYLTRRLYENIDMVRYM